MVNLSILSKWEVLVRPDFVHVKNIPLVVLYLFRAHELDINVPNRVIFIFNYVKQILEQVVGSFSNNPRSFLSGKILNSLLSFDVDLDVFEIAML